MGNKHLNRIKVVLVGKNLSNKWLAEKLSNDPATISDWVTNKIQPNIGAFIQISSIL